MYFILQIPLVFIWLVLFPTIIDTAFYFYVYDLHIARDYFIQPF